jgi:hypothetical protein
MIPARSNDPRNRGGARVPDPEDNINAPPRTVTNISRIQFFAIEFGDGEGRRHRTAIVKVGGQLFRDPNGEEWARRLIRMPEDTWMHVQVEKMIADRMAAITTKDDPLPTTDAVDVMGDTK